MSHEFLDPKKDAQASENQQQPKQQKVDVAAQMKWLDFLAHPERNTSPDDILDNSTPAQRFAKDEEEERPQRAQAKTEASQQRKAAEEEELQQTGYSSGQ